MQSTNKEGFGSMDTAMSANKASKPDSKLAAKYGMNWQLDSEDDSDGSSATHESFGGGSKQDSSSKVDLSQQGSLARPYVLQRLPTGKYGIPTDGSQTQTMFNDKAGHEGDAYNSDAVDSEGEDVDSAIDDDTKLELGSVAFTFAGVKKVKRRLPMKPEQQEETVAQIREKLKSFSSQLANPPPDRDSPTDRQQGATPNSEIDPLSSTSPKKKRKSASASQSPTPKKPVKSHAQRRIEREDREQLKEQQKVEAKKAKAENAEAKAKHKKEHAKFMDRKRRADRMERLHGPDVEMKMRLAVVEDIVVRGAALELFETARVWLHRGQDGPAALVELTWIEGDWNSGEDGDDVVFKKILKLLERYAAIPLGAVDC